MPQIPADPPAQIQPDAAGPLIRSAVASGIPVLQNPGQVLRSNADARIPDAQPLLRLYRNGDRPLRVYFSALESTCSTTKESHFSSVTTVVSTGS